jgi:uncharacterized membrane protein YcaP (DUF421 family)
LLKVVIAIEAPKVLEIIIRVLVIYVACMVLVRPSGRRELSELGPLDLLAMLLLSETVSPALTGGEDSITAGLVAAATLMGLTVLTSWLAFRNARVDRLLQGETVVLIEDGRVRRDVMRDFRIASDDLTTALHQHGMIHVNEVARAYLEPDGEITMIKRKDYEEAQRYIRDKHRR